MVINLKGVENIINSMHPMNVVNRVGKITINLYKVKIEYITHRNNKKQREIYFILNTPSPEKCLNEEVFEWTNDYNSKKNEHKQISNVTILESLCVGIISI